ncbi:hypothetical protein OG462_41420 [Streptomyces sp. NBC_01077]|uniref:hypothetical protein n=1 Tax=Streptomyces sp. NBC_01077 TaxID=2903746 RepID=UPI0038633808|nr:hypothetical protein OG462_41420 [Streptomyces sp. NBC_01077]
MPRDDLIAMLREQTPVCGPARDALIAGGDFLLWDDLVPANRRAGVFLNRMRLALRRGYTIDGLADSIDILLRAEEELVRTGCIDAVDRSSVFTILLNSTATVVTLSEPNGWFSTSLIAADEGRDRRAHNIVAGHVT